MGREKALLAWPPHPLGEQQPPLNETFLAHHIQLLRPHARPIFVVLGANYDTLAEMVTQLGGTPVRNPQPERGQFSSLQTGVQAAQEQHIHSVFVTPVDRPPVAESTLTAIKDVWQSTPEDVWAVVPATGPRHGHPIIAGERMMMAWLFAPAGVTARNVEHAHQPHIRYVPVADPLLTININTPEDYARLLAEFSGVAR